MSKRTPKLLVEDILESIVKINKYTLGTDFQKFISDEKTLDAVIRNFEIIGEASARLPDECKERFGEIDWDRMRGFRNRIVHDYFGIDYEIVWNIMKQTLPDFEKQIKSIIEKFTTEDSASAKERTKR